MGKHILTLYLERGTGYPEDEVKKDLVTFFSVSLNDIKSRIQNIVLSSKGICVLQFMVLVLTDKKKDDELTLEIETFIHEVNSINPPWRKRNRYMEKSKQSELK